jgi:hypothetical protein
MTDMAGSLYAARSADDCGDGRGGFEDEFVAALLSGGDSRLAIDPRTGANKYLCRPTPARDLVYASSCTASPISEQSFRRAADLHASLVAGRSPGERADALERCAHDLEARLLTYFGANGLAEAILCPSGTDALQTATLLVGLERPDEKMTAILPQTSETGTGVPLAATLRPFDLPAASDVPLADCAAGSIAIPLRTEDGVPRSDDAVMEGFAFAVAGVKGRPVVYLTHGTKTGLIAPVEPPDGVDVIIDACQGRIEPATVVRYLRSGWPVVVTGSKFFGGPAFSGAVLFPSARLADARLADARLAGARLAGARLADARLADARLADARLADARLADARHGIVPELRRRMDQARSSAGNIGMLLRWSAALDAIEAFAPLADTASERLRTHGAAIEQGLGRIATLVPVAGLSNGGSGWSGVPTIFTFAVRDPADRQRLLTASELRPIYTRLANNGVLLGQPVGLGRFGGLRIAIGARDVLDGAPARAGLPLLFAALDAATRA